MLGIQFNLKKFGVGLAIVIIFNLFINYGINIFYKTPKYENFCKPERLKQSLNTRESCEAVGGLWTENIEYEGKQIYAPESSGWCDQDFTCRKDFEGIDNIYRSNVFIIWIIVGIATIVASFFMITAQMLSTSFMFSGLLSLIIGTFHYWSEMQDYLRFIILGIALGVLIYLAHRKLK